MQAVNKHISRVLPIHPNEPEMHRSRSAWDNLTQVVKAGNDDFSINCLFKDERMKAKVGAQKGQHVNSVTGSSGDFDGFINRLPSVRQTRVEREAGFIKVVEIDLAGFSLRAEAFQFCLRGLKVHFIAFATQAAPETLPNFPAFLENASEGIATDGLPGLFLNLERAPLGRPRIFLNEFDRCCSF